MFDKIFEYIENAVDFLWELIGLEGIHDDEIYEEAYPNEDGLLEHLRELDKVDGCWVLLIYPNGYSEAIWVIEDAVRLGTGGE